MLFRPKQELLWDTWLVLHSGVYYLFYIRVSLPAPSLYEGWGIAINGISMARSYDLLHWEEVGPVLEKHPKAIWLGTGMIHKAGNDFVMNFSEERPVGHQVICLAKSQDLLRWNRLSVEYEIRPDSRYYQTEQSESADPLPRWDSLGVVPPSDKRSEYLAFICANAREVLPGHCGTLGLLQSRDGLHWEQLPPVVEPGLFPSYEVPEYVRFDGRHYVMFSTNTTAGPRFDPRAKGPHGGTYYVVADNIKGPYVKPPSNYLLLGQRDTAHVFGTYVGRSVRTDEGECLFYHHWTVNFPEGWWGPPKVLVERQPYQLGLNYWFGCEGLKASLLAEGVQEEALRPLKAAGKVPVIEWSANDGSVEAVNRGGAQGASWEVPPGERSQSFTDLSDGRVLETRVRIQQGRGLGIWIGYHDESDSVAVLLNAEAGAVEFGRLAYCKDGASLVFEPKERILWPIGTGVSHALRVLARRNFVEVYLDDRLVHSFCSQKELDANRLGFYAELAGGDFLMPRLWAMA